MRKNPVYFKRIRKCAQFHNNVEMGQSISNAKRYCGPDVQKMESERQEEGHILEIDADEGDCGQSDVLDSNVKDFNQKSSGLFETAQFFVPLELSTAKARNSTIEKNKDFVSEMQNASNTQSTISMETGNDRHFDGSDSKALGAEATTNCKAVSRSKFYFECSDEDTSTSSGEYRVRLLDEHKLYIQRTSHKGLSRQCSNSNLKQDHHHLFDCLLLLGLTIGPEETKVPYTLIKYPPDAHVPPYTENLCFPDAQQWTPSSYEQSYSLVLTTERGKRKFVYCRRVLPEGSPVCLPLAYCILTPFRARGFYHNILKELESRHGQPDDVLLAFISSLYNSKFPEPGQTFKFVHIRRFAEDPLDEMLPNFRRPQDLRTEEQDLAEMFEILEIPVLVKIIGSVLLERKVIFISNSFSKLSSCAEAIQSILYPFSWQHVLISVLPHSLLEICQSPTPYIVGLLEDCGNCLLESMHSFQGGIIVNLDASKVLCEVGDESNILPRTSLRHLKASLEPVIHATGNDCSMRNVLISEAFLRMFADLCGHYRHHILTLNGEVVFDRESFVQSASSGRFNLFLKWFVETSMFSAFIDSRLQNEHEEDMFDHRAFERAEEQLKQNKGGKGKNKNLKDRFKSWI